MTGAQAIVAMGFICMGLLFWAVAAGGDTGDDE